MITGTCKQGQHGDPISAPYSMVATPGHRASQRLIAYIKHVLAAVTSLVKSTQRLQGTLGQSALPFLLAPIGPYFTASSINVELLKTNPGRTHSTFVLAVIVSEEVQLLKTSRQRPSGSTARVYIRFRFTPLLVPGLNSVQVGFELSRFPYLGRFLL